MNQPKAYKLLLLMTSLCYLSSANSSTSDNVAVINNSLHWITNDKYRCGGYYQEIPLKHPVAAKQINISSKEYDFSENGVSTLTGSVTINYGLRQIIANRAYLHHALLSKKLNSINLVTGLQISEPALVILATSGAIDFTNKQTYLTEVLYRIAIYGDISHLSIPAPTAAPQNTLNAWGQAKQYLQIQAGIYNFLDTSYSTCPPNNLAWQIKAKKIIINKNTGKGHAKHLFLLVHHVPLFYMPYLTFPIDARRMSGVLWPNFGSVTNSNGYAGYYFSSPIYLNLAPNYDTILTPVYHSNRGLQLNNKFRYLTKTTTGTLNFSILPDDLYFPIFKAQLTSAYANSSDSYRQATLRRLLRTNNTRTAISWQQQSNFSDNLSANIDYNYVSDDYFLEDFNTILATNLQNQLLQKAELHYDSKYWNFIGRVQGYETLQPLDTDTIFTNQYILVPQLSLNTYYNTAALNYFSYSEVSHFELQHTPGSTQIYPTGNRFHFQPGLAKSFNWPFFFIKPSVQLALTTYNLKPNTISTTVVHRSVPIFEINSGVYLERNFSFFAKQYLQTVAPELYYVYIPYRQQHEIPLFDTTLNTMNYAQLFNYNRFTGIDRINDANQLSYGISSHIVDPVSGLEKLRGAIGEIFYFKPRRVTLYAPLSGFGAPFGAQDNTHNLSAAVAELSFQINATWNVASNIIWDPTARAISDENISLQYQHDRRMLSLQFSYLSNNLPDNMPNPTNLGITNKNVLKLTDFMVRWPLTTKWGVVGRWAEDWHTLHFQNIFYGLQYDSCCWSAQFVAGRNLVKIQENKPQYSNQLYMQISLKGLGAFNTNSNLLTTAQDSISDYQAGFGQDV